jgi:hypothetical protein
VCASYRATCTLTKYGSFCMASKFELGSAAPEAGAGGGAGTGGAGGGSASGTGGAGGGG